MARCRCHVPPNPIFGSSRVDRMSLGDDALSGSTSRGVAQKSSVCLGVSCLASICNRIGTAIAQHHEIPHLLEVHRVLQKPLSSFVIVISLLGAIALVEAGNQDPYPPPPFGPGSAIRLEITPKEAEVFADGYFAGIVDEFDGVFQRLYLASGQHEIVLYRD